jgi:hypothetical protein
MEAETLIRIAIAAEACEAMAETLPLGSTMYEAQFSAEA